MKRHVFEVNATQEQELIPALLEHCAQSSHSSFLHSNGHEDTYYRYDWLAAFGAEEILVPKGDYFESLKKFHNRQQDWLFGHLCYDLKNELENLTTSGKNKTGFAPLLFFVPQTVVFSVNGKITVQSTRHQNEADFLQNLSRKETIGKELLGNIQLQAQTSREEYLQKVESLKKHLQFGNIYEVNYCIEFASEVKEFQALAAFKKLNDSARSPFSAFYKNNEHYLLCSSPERYLQKHGEVIISQPIKGTIKRASDPVEDALLKEELQNSEKERSENIMITDLVRNDLSRTADKASVKVNELCGIYSFNTVHQMISTVQSRMAPRFHFADVLKTTFPMGSMTGAPKYKAMQLIDEHENFARNLYSGAVGYITPNGDFDFNVVIRSIFYNGNTHYLSARVGSAITIHCQAEAEYDECLLKGKNLFKSLRRED